uniref:Uncharacterized protein n=1 Tax=Brassica oleracea TaxID=3712 RepID=A0A3P6GNI1_BRAOL|nr:unnamed protein product [Brassica oleracea]
MVMLSRNFASYLKEREGMIKNRRRSDLYRSSSKCNGFRHVQKECVNLLKQKKKNDAKNESYTDSDDGEQLRNFVAFTTLESVLRQNLQ